ncbi:zinc-ribbon domain-containing protein [Dankookia rubra]|nr:zinc-ribbon domain-containing protein [Dankookia rubra]
MRIICPACAAAYEVPDRLIGTGRSLRCKTCGHAWRVQPEDGAAGSPAPGSAAPPPAPSPAFAPLAGLGALPDPPPQAPPPGLSGLHRAPQLIDPPLPQPPDGAGRGDPALRLAWAASLLAVLGMGTALWLFRAEIVGAWPPAARLYLMFGVTAIG